MNLWLDNTGLQAAGQCLMHRAKTDYDVRGLLQLATFIIYADKLELNGFEHIPIASRSRQIRDEILSFGLESSALAIKDVTSDAYGLACETTAIYVASELPHRFHPDEHELIGAEPPNLTPGITQRQFLFVKLADLSDSSDELTKTRESALEDKAVGAVEYMLAICPELRAAIVRMIRDHGNWTDSHSYQLNVFLRYHLNDALAEQGFAT